MPAIAKIFYFQMHFISIRQQKAFYHQKYRPFIPILCPCITLSSRQMPKTCVLLLFLQDLQTFVQHRIQPIRPTAHGLRPGHKKICPMALTTGHIAYFFYWPKTSISHHITLLKNHSTPAGSSTLQTRSSISSELTNSTCPSVNVTFTPRPLLYSVDRISGPPT